MLQAPAGAPTQFPHDGVAIAQELDVKVVVFDGLARNVNLRDLARNVVAHVAHGRDLERGPDHDDEIGGRGVDVAEPVEEERGQLFAEKGDVRFHDAGAGKVVVFVVG